MILFTLRPLMKFWWRKLAVLLLFVALPLQGAAAVLGTLSCFSADEYQTAHPHANAQQDGSSDHEDGNTISDSSQHHGCHFFSSSLPASVVKTAPADLPAFESSISLLATLFIPERPQRPPRS
jgi:hypothetical protein